MCNAQVVQHCPVAVLPSSWSAGSFHIDTRFNGRRSAVQESLLDAQPQAPAGAPADEASLVGRRSPTPLAVPDLAASLSEVAAKLKRCYQVRPASLALCR